MARFREYRKELIAAFTGVVATALISLSLSPEIAVGWVAGYFLGLIAVAMHLCAVWLIKDFDKRDFVERYYLGMFIRFLLTLGLFTSLLVLTEIEQISFTLSFIISYIFHSGIDIILINKNLQKRSSINS